MGLVDAVGWEMNISRKTANTFGSLANGGLEEVLASVYLQNMRSGQLTNSIGVDMGAYIHQPPCTISQYLDGTST